MKYINCCCRYFDIDFRDDNFVYYNFIYRRKGE